jgi:hypothetical protein
MVMKPGDIFRCTNPDCGCELTVIQESHRADASSKAPHCCCGAEMENATGWNQG